MRSQGTSLQPLLDEDIAALFPIDQPISPTKPLCKAEADVDDGCCSWLPSGLPVFGWCLMCIFGNVAQSVSIKLCGLAFPSNPYFVFWVSCLPFFLSFHLFLIMLRVVWPAEITQEMRDIPERKFIAFGLLNAANGTLLLYSNAHVSGLLQALLGPTIVTVPLGMLFRCVFVLSPVVETRP